MEKKVLKSEEVEGSGIVEPRVLTEVEFNRKSELYAKEVNGLTLTASEVEELAYLNEIQGGEGLNSDPRKTADVTVR